ncbi:aminotransferase class V [marine bacterium AO1-C]|nr:aminotransferase class V [marine bacterium AO1-C]
MLTCQKELFSLPEEVTYLNNAYMAPSLKSVSEAGLQGIHQKNTPYVISPQDFFAPTETLREDYAHIINATNPQQIVTVPSISYGIANAAQNIDFQAGDEILLIDEQFPSNYYIWERLAREQQLTIKTITPPTTLENRGQLWNESILEAINAKTKVVSMGQVHWADGTKFDLMRIRQKTRMVDALLILDGTQSVGALPFDVQVIQPDALICAAYKWLMGPYSIGLAYYGEYFNQGKPIEESWMNRYNSEDFANLVNYQDAYQPGALRYEVGEHSNFILIPMLSAAIRQINEWGVENIQEYCRRLTTPFIEQLQKLGCWVEDEAYRGAHLFGVRLPEGVDVTEVKNTFAQEKIYVSVRGNAVRIATHLYNDEKDWQKLLNCFEQVLTSKTA